MDGMDLFRKLGSGTKFNFKRFQNDARKLQLIKPQSDMGVNIRISKASGNDDNSGEVDIVQKIRKRKHENDVKDTSAVNDDDSSLPEDLRLLGEMKTKPTAVEPIRKKRKKSAKSKTKVQLKAEAKQEKVNHFRRCRRIHVYGPDISDPVETIDDLAAQYHLNQTIVANVKAQGFENLTAIQMQATPVMMHRRQVLACAPTGSGKTLAFILPVLHSLGGPQKKGFRALVLSPTRELASQTHREFVRISEGTGLQVHIINNIHKAAKKFGPNSNNKCGILVTTPNKVVNMISQDPPLLSLHAVEWLIVDESDKLFEEGKTGFRDQLAAVYKACDSQNLCRAMFSATFTHEVEEWCRLNLDNVVQVYVGARNSATSTVEQQLLFVGSEAGKLMAVRDCVSTGLEPPVLIFVQSKERANEVYQELVYDKLNVDVIHADRPQAQRDKVVKQFRAGNTWILICTELMGRGIDFKGVNLVINFDFPTSAISYIHRIGRTGRAGRTGKAITFFTEQDIPSLRSIANVMKEAGCPVPEYMLKIQKLDRKERRKLARSAPHRKSVRTFPKAGKKRKHRMLQSVHTK